MAIIIYITLFLITIFIIGKALDKRRKTKPVEFGKKPVTFLQIYHHYKIIGYIETCRVGNYKFSSYRLKEILQNSDKLANMDINKIEEAKKISGVGYKVYDLINHLVTKYKEEIINS